MKALDLPLYLSNGVSIRQSRVQWFWSSSKKWLNVKELFPACLDPKRYSRNKLPKAMVLNQGWSARIILEILAASL